MSDIMGSGGTGTDVIRVELNFATRNISNVLKQLEKVKSTLAQVSKMSAGGGKSKTATEVAEFQKLVKEIKNAGKASHSFGQAQMVGVQKPLKDSKKAMKAFNDEVRRFKADQFKAGTAIVGKPRDWTMLRKNYRDLKTNIRDVQKAGIANTNSLKTMEDGMARVGGRGLTSFEALRVRSFALKKDLDVVGTKMSDLGKTTSWFGRQMMINLTLPLVGFAAAASREFLKVQSQFFQLQKVMEFKMGDEDGPKIEYDMEGNIKPPSRAALEKAFEPLRKEIISMSEEFGQSQAVVTGVFRDVAALGFNDENLIKGWSQGISEIAAIGDIDFKTATEFFRTSNALFTDANTTQAERLKETNKLMAQFNAISDETSLQLQDLADAFPEIAPVMEKMGFTAAETGSALAGAFKLGIPATEAAHAFKFGFQRIVGPTKDAQKAIEDLNIEFFDMAGNTGGIGQARTSLLAMAKSLDGLSDEQYGNILGDIVGNRQTARWGSFLKSVLEGEQQLANALADRKLETKELDEISSDYMRGLLASGEISRQYAELVKAGMLREEDVPDLGALEDPAKRYQLAIDAYKEDPATQWNIMITTMKNALIEMGKTIVPVITEWGQKLADLAGWFSDLPDSIKKSAAAVLALAAAFGPFIVAIGALKSLGGSGLKVMSRLVPKMGIRDIMADDAMRLLQESPDRQDIFRVGNRLVRSKTGSPGTAWSAVTGAPGMEQIAGMSAAQKAGLAAGVSDDALKKTSDMAKALDEQTNAHNALANAQKAQLAAATGNAPEVLELKEKNAARLAEMDAEKKAGQEKVKSAKKDEERAKRTLTKKNNDFIKATQQHEKDLQKHESRIAKAKERAAKADETRDGRLKARTQRRDASTRKVKEARGVLEQRQAKLDDVLAKRAKGQFGGGTKQLKEAYLDVEKAKGNLHILEQERAARQRSLEELRKEPKELARKVRQEENALKTTQKNFQEKVRGVQTHQSAAASASAQRAAAEQSQINMDRKHFGERLRMLAAQDAATKKSIATTTAATTAAQQRVRKADEAALAARARNASAASTADLLGSTRGGEKRAEKAAEKLAKKEEKLAAKAEKRADKLARRDVLRQKRQEVFATKGFRKTLTPVTDVDIGDKHVLKRIGIQTKAFLSLRKSGSMAYQFIANSAGKASMSMAAVDAAMLASQSRKAKAAQDAALWSSVMGKGTGEKAARGSAKTAAKAAGKGGIGQMLAGAFAIGPLAKISKILAPITKLIMKFGIAGKLAAGVLPVILTVGAKVLIVVGLIVGALGAIAIAIGGAVKVITENWDKIRTHIEPAVQALRSAFDRVKEALQKVGEVFMNTIMGTLFKGFSGDKAEQDSNLWVTAATMIEWAIDKAATAFEWVANIIETVVVPVFSYFANYIGSVVGFWGKIFSKDFTGALKYFVKFLYSMLQPIFWIVEKIAEAFIWLIEKVVWAIKQIAKGAVWLISWIPGLDGAVDGVENFFNSWEEGLGSVRQQDWVGGLGRAIDGWLENSKFEVEYSPKADDKTEDEAGDAGDVAADAFNEQFNDGVADGAGKGAGEDIANNILKDFLSTLIPKLQDQMNKIKETLQEAFQKNKDAKLKVFDDQIKKIEDLEAAEEKLLRTQEYLESKRELMRKRSLDIENYRRNRALAIYEGRISDVRQLDIDFMLSNKDNNKSLADLERDRAKSLIDEDRENAKERIRIQKEAEEERLAILEKAFNEQLDTILEYAPRTVAEFEGMFDQMRSLMAQFGIDWPTSLQTAAGYYLIALQKANESITEQFGLGGEAGIMAWVLGFINSEAWGILQQGISDRMGDVGAGGGGGGNPGGGSGEGQWTAEEIKFFKMLELQNALGQYNNFPDIQEKRKSKASRWSTDYEGILAYGPKHPMWQDAVKMENAIWGKPKPSSSPLRGRTPAKIDNPQYLPSSERGGRASGIGRDTIAGLEKSFQNTGTLKTATNNLIQSGVIAPAEKKLETQSPSKVFYRIGVDTVSGFNQGIGSGPMWNFVKATIRKKIDEIAVDFGSIGPKITQSLGSLGAQLSFWFSMEMSKASTSIARAAGIWLLSFSGFGSRVIRSMGQFGPQLASLMSVQMAQGGASVSRGIERWVDRFDRAPRLITMAVAPLGPSLLLTFSNIFRTLDAILPTNIALIASRFASLPRLIVSALSGLGQTILNFIGAELKYVRDNIRFQISLTADAFSSFGQQIIDAITGSTFTAEGGSRELGKSVFNSLVKYINREILEELKFYEIPRGIPGLEGRRPFEGIQYLSQILHAGGIVGGKGATTGREVMTTLQSGEGVLPISAMKKIGPKAFESLRRGAVGDVVAMAAAGKVVGYTPRIPAMSASALASKDGQMPGGDTYICVDTFIGEEQWFKEMADKYDMKVTARKAKANGSQRRVISSYNTNERNTYR